jgi:hypothetical protein
MPLGSGAQPASDASFYENRDEILHRCCRPALLLIVNHLVEVFACPSIAEFGVQRINDMAECDGFARLRRLEFPGLRQEPLE